MGGISAAFMNFSIGFFVGGQVLAGILGSAVTLPYGPEGKHGANYMQTMAASVAGMCGMSALVQAMVWLGLPQPPFWQLVLYFLCIGMFGVGLGMLYTPILVDRLQLTYPSGLAVANILRALTDKQLLKRSIFKLGGSMAGAFGVSLAAAKIPALGGLWNLSVSTVGAGMIVGARIALPALWVGLIGYWQTPHLLQIGWLDKGDHYRAIGFIISLGAIMGAAMLDVGHHPGAGGQALPGHGHGGGGTRAGLETGQHDAPDYVGRLLGRGHGVDGQSSAASTGRLPAAGHLPLFCFCACQRHRAGHFGLQSHFRRLRHVGLDHGRRGLDQSGGGFVLRGHPGHFHQRGGRHAAGSLHRLAPGHQSHRAIPLPGHRHRHGRAC